MKGIKINSRKLEAISKPAIRQRVYAEAAKRIHAAVKRAHQQMLQEFESHPVTQEIDSGPNGYNQSGTLGGYGNLFSFIGFEEGMDPVSPIRFLLKKALQIKKIDKNQQNIIMEFLVELPSKEDIFQATPMPWASGRSWAEGIEKGISGLGMYLNVESFGSRSGEGVQSKNKVRSGGFRNTQYLSNILNNLQKEIRKAIK
jgi:hypothetical protein